MRMHIQKFILFSFILGGLISCKKEDKITYPKSYTFSHIDEGIEGLFLVNNQTTATELNVNTGSYGAQRSEIKEFVVDFMKQIIDIQEIELLSEDQVRLHILFDGEELDTTVTYTVEDKEIIIEALDSSNLISYNADEDQFELCGFTYVGIDGPNTVNPGQQYGINTMECTKEATLQKYLNMLLSQFPYNPLDTIGIFEIKIAYK